MRRIPLFTTYLIALGLVATPVFAQVADQLAADVKIRGGAHDGYTRIVFDWPKAPKYSAKQEAGALTLTFSEAAKFTVDGAAPETLARVSGFKTLPTGAEIDFAQGNTVRHFVIGSRVIVDIKGDAKKTAEPVKETPPAKKEEPAKTEAAKAPETKPAEPEKPVEPAATTPAAAQTAATPPAATQEGAAKPASPLAPAAGKFDTNFINITSTQATGLAVFERFGNLWIVVDEADFPLAPQISGPQKDKFPPFERVALTGATAFRMPIPEGLRAYGEGGGLVWKIAMTPTPRKIEGREFKRSFDPKQKPGGKLVWESAMTRRVIDLPDPDAGDLIKVVTVSGAGDYAGEPQSFVELGTLPSRAGLAFVTKVDDLEVTRDDKGISITRPGGLSLSAESDIASIKMREPNSAPEEELLGEPDKADEATAVAAGTPTNKQPDAKTGQPAGGFTRVFAFDRWLMGGLPAIRENQRVIMSALREKTDQGKAEDLITLGKMELANGRGPEALGYFEFASQMVPDLAANPEFIALHGASQALLGQYDRAFRDFSNKALDPITEIKYWRAYCLAELEDWKQAEEVMPKDISLLGQYPEGVRIPLALTMSEIALRAGDTAMADSILDLLSKLEPTMSLAHKSAYKYMRGESFRQQGEFEPMAENWEALAKGKDDLYRAKAGLALTVQRLEKKEMPLDKAIDALEGLRYAWRGDELETAINYKLGRIYMDNGQPIKGLTLLRQAVSLAPGSDLGKQITAYMSDSFKNLYLTDKINELNPIDAVTIYDEFSELIPVGDEGDRIARQLAERLVDADLLPRAANLLQKQVSNGKAGGVPGAEIALRLASIQLLDGKPAAAVDTLNKAGEFLLNVPLDAGAAKRREIALLRARAQSDLKQPEEAFAALALLPQEPDVLRLRADIAWRSKRWQDAADTLEELVGKMNIDMTKPLDAAQADAILNWAVALYLADNRYVLVNLREKYADAMAQTPLAKKFEVVTRPRQNALLADRATINTIIGETDIFKGFLDGFNAPPKPAAAPAPAADKGASPAPAPAPAPATTPAQ